MTTKQPVPKSKIALAAALAVAVLGYGSYVAYDSMSTKIPAPALQESTSTTLNPMDTLNQPVPEPVVSRQAVFVPSPAASEIISFEKQASVQTARFNALTAQKNADEAANKLNNPTAPIAALIEQMAEKPKEPSLLDLIVVKSLIESGGEIVGMVSVGGELIDVKRGTKIGDVSVIGITAESITFSDGHTTKTRRVKSY
jgi:Tfp pilus assembly protein PilP